MARVSSDTGSKQGPLSSGSSGSNRNNSGSSSRGSSSSGGSSGYSGYAGSGGFYSSNGGRSSLYSSSSSNRNNLGSSGFSGSSPKTLSPNHPAYEPAGAERVSGSLSGVNEGWIEHESSKHYKNTADRMNEHLNKYGRDKSYTYTHNMIHRNEYKRAYQAGKTTEKNDEKKGISSSQAAATDSLTNNDLANEKDYSREQLEKEISQINLNTPPSKIRELTIATELAKQQKIVDRNFMGGLVGDAIATGVTPTNIYTAVGSKLVAPEAGKRIGSWTAERGTVLDGKQFTKAQYEAMVKAKKEFNSAINKEESTWGSKIAKYAAKVGTFALSVITGPVGAAFGSAIGAGVNHYNKTKAIEKVGNSLNNPYAKNWAKERNEGIQRGIATDKHIRSYGHSKGYSDNRAGILRAMSANPSQNQGTQIEDLPYYSIPNIDNLWNEVKIKNL